MNKYIFDQILKESELSLNDLFFKAGMCLSEIVEITKKRLSIFLSEKLDGKLNESTKFGNKYLKEIQIVVSNFIGYNNTIKERLDNYDSNKSKNFLYSISVSDIENLIEMFDECESSHILQILRLVWKNKSCDEEDKLNVHKACQEYDRIYKEYEHSFNKLKIKQSSLRHITMKGFKIPNLVNNSLND